MRRPTLSHSCRIACNMLCSDLNSWTRYTFFRGQVTRASTSLYDVNLTQSYCALYSVHVLSFYGYRGLRRENPFFTSVLNCVWNVDVFLKVKYSNKNWDGQVRNPAELEHCDWSLNKRIFGFIVYSTLIIQHPTTYNFEEEQNFSQLESLMH